MQAVVDAGRRMDFGSLTLPVLMVVSRHDEVVDVKAAEDVFGRIASTQKKFEVLPGSNRHELAGHAIDDALVAPLAELVSSFFARVISGR
jgi:esterase/lipase